MRQRVNFTFGHVKLRILKINPDNLMPELRQSRLRGRQNHSQHLQLDWWVGIFQEVSHCRLRCAQYPKAEHPCNGIKKNKWSDQIYSNKFPYIVFCEAAQR